MFYPVLILYHFPFSGKLLHDGFWISDRLNRLVSAHFCSGFCKLHLFSWKLFSAFNLLALAIYVLMLFFRAQFSFSCLKIRFCNCFLFSWKFSHLKVFSLENDYLCNCFLLKMLTSVIIFFRKTFTHALIFCLKTFLLQLICFGTFGFQ